MGFRRIQAANLSQWKGNAQDPQWRLLITEISHLVRGAGTVPLPPRKLTPSEQLLLWLRAHRQQATLLAFGAIALVAVLAAIWWHAVASVPRQEAAAGITGAAAPSGTPTAAMDQAVVGTLTLDTVVADFNTHYVNQIQADGSYVLTGVQEEDGTNGADAQGNFRNVGANTGRVHTGTVQIIDGTHFRANTALYELVKPVLPPGQPNPNLLGIWATNGIVSGQHWNWTFTSTTPGAYHFEGHFADHGQTNFSHGLWTATSLVTGLAGGGTYAIVDSTHLLINGTVWKKER
jgi:hypothetical protein